MSDGVSLYVKDAWHSYDMHTYQTERQPEGLTGYLFEFARMRSSSRGLTAEVKVFQTYNGTETVDAPTQMYGPVEFNLLSGSWRNKAGIVGALQHGLPEFEWLDILQKIISTTIDSFRGSMEQGRGRDYEQDEDSYPFLLTPYISESGVTVLFAPGGTGKSTLAVLMAMSVTNGVAYIGEMVHEQGNVLWVDYEANKKEVFDRQLAVFRGEGGEHHPEFDIHYRRYAAKFSDIASDVRHHIKELDPKLIVVDSVANARLGDANAAEATVAMFAVMGTLQVPVLAIDHMSAEAAAKQDFTKPYGSVYTTNEARLTWGVMTSESASTPERRQLNLKMAKQNTIKQAEARGIVLGYESFSTGKIRSLTVKENGGIWDGEFNPLSNSERVIRVFMEHGSEYMTKRQLEEGSEMHESVVYRTIKAMEVGGIVEKKKLGGQQGGAWGYKLVESQ